MKKNIEDILKQALIKFNAEKVSQAKGNCLTDNEMASFLDGKISESKRNTIFEHLLSCSKCAKEVKENLAILDDLEMKGLMETPKELIQIAMDLVKPKKTPQMESKQQHEKPVESMAFAEERESKYAPACYGPPMPFKIINFVVVSPPFARRERTAGSLRIIKKIYFICNYNCYIYLFEIKERRINIIVGEQKVLKGVKNELISKIKKTLAISKKGRLILIFTRKSLKDLCSVRKVLRDTFGSSARQIEIILKYDLKDKNIVVKVF